MKKILLFVAIATLSFKATSQEKYTDKDPKAKVILDRLSAKHKAIDNIVIESNTVVIYLGKRI